MRLISGPAEDEDTVTVREMRDTMSALDEHLSRLGYFIEQLEARGVSCEWFDALMDWHAGSDFEKSWDYWYRYRDDSDDSAPDQYVADCEAEDDEAEETDDEDEATDD